MLTCQRDLYSLPEGLHYLNCAARSPLLKSAEAAALAALQRLRVPGLLMGELIGEAYQCYAGPLRAGIAQLINAPPEAIALVPAASYGVAIAAHAVRLQAGQNVVLPGEEFPSDVYAWLSACADAGAELRLVPRPEDAERPGRVWSERLLEAIDARTAVVNLSAIHWTDGLRFDLDAIGRRAREVGALFVVDGSQVAGAAPLDFRTLQPDLLVGVGYKWLMGPFQLGFAAVGERLREARPFENHWANRPADATRGGDHYATDYLPGARRFDGGEHANPITLPLFREGVRQVLAWGTEAIQAYCESLLGRLQALADGGRVRMLPREERWSHIVGLRLADSAALPGVMERLRQRNVQVSQRGGSLRVSLHVYNTPADLDALCDTLEAVLR
jgi:selenocysteine lyase/cysteine desulfurase